MSSNSSVVRAPRRTPPAPHRAPRRRRRSRRYAIAQRRGPAPRRCGPSSVPRASAPPARQPARRADRRPRGCLRTAITSVSAFSASQPMSADRHVGFVARSVCPGRGRAPRADAYRAPDWWRCRFWPRMRKTGSEHDETIRIEADLRVEQPAGIFGPRRRMPCARAAAAMRRLRRRAGVTDLGEPRGKDDGALDAAQSEYPRPSGHVLRGHYSPVSALPGRQRSARRAVPTGRGAGCTGEIRGADNSARAYRRSDGRRCASDVGRADDGDRARREQRRNGQASAG